MTPALKTLTNCDIFAIRRAVIAFRRGQTLTIILNRVPPARGHHLLFQDAPNAIVACVAHYPRVQPRVEYLQYRRAAQHAFKCVKRMFLLLPPLEFLVLSSKEIQGAWDLGESQDEAAIIVAQPQKLLHMCNRFWNWPRLYSNYLTSFHTNSRRRHNMT